MSGRILIIDPVPTNRIVMRVKLASAFYEVLLADSGRTALAGLRRTRPDLIITSANLTDMSGRAFCAELRKHPFGNALPVVMIHNGADPSERLAALAAGADDVLPRPADDLILLARIRSLLRARASEAELELREDTRRALGMAEQSETFAVPGHVVVVAAPDALARMNFSKEALRRALGHNVVLCSADDLLRKTRPEPDVVVLAESPDGSGETLRLLPQLRANTHTRHAAVIYVSHPGQREKAASALDMGANDLLLAGTDQDELALRIQKQIERKRLNDRLRENMRDGLRAAIIDPLTGLYNRRYAVPHLNRLAEVARQKGKTFALLLVDVDHFKRINDAYGHASGDDVLRELALRLRANLRASDLLARYGGEEFLIAMPNTNRAIAQAMAERFCHAVAEQPITLRNGTTITLTLSVGVALGTPQDGHAPEVLIQKADQALYCAKDQGRNTVVMADRIASLSVPRGRNRKTLTPPTLLNVQPKTAGL